MDHRSSATKLAAKIAARKPENIVRQKRSYTGRFLKPVLARSSPARGKKKRIEAAE